MASKASAASAANDLREATVAGNSDRDGVQYPSLRLSGDAEAPRKGSNLRVRLDNGVIYTGKVFGVTEDGLVETEGLTPETPEPPAPPPSDIVAG